MLLFIRSFFPACLMTRSGLFRISSFKWSHISSVVAPWSPPFKIESPIIATAVCLHFYVYHYDLFFLVLLFYHKSLCFWFSFIGFGFISLLGLWNNKLWNNELPSWEAWPVLLFYISASVQLSVTNDVTAGSIIAFAIRWQQNSAVNRNLTSVYT